MPAESPSGVVTSPSISPPGSTGGSGSTGSTSPSIPELSDTLQYYNFIFKDFNVISFESILLLIFTFTLSLIAVRVHSTSKAVYDFLIDWAEPLAKQHFETHGISQEEAEKGFFNTKMEKIPFLNKLRITNLEIYASSALSKFILFLSLIIIGNIIFQISTILNFHRYDINFGLLIVSISEEIILFLSVLLVANGVYHGVYATLHYVTAFNFLLERGELESLAKSSLRGGILTSSLTLLGSAASISGLILYILSK